MEKGLVIPPKDRTKMTNSVLVSLINQLEKVPFRSLQSSSVGFL
jgi:vacuolar protein sorting-associated protein VTA1